MRDAVTQEPEAELAAAEMFADLLREALLTHYSAPVRPVHRVVVGRLLRGGGAVALVAALDAVREVAGRGPHRCRRMRRAQRTRTSTRRSRSARTRTCWSESRRTGWLTRKTRWGLIRRKLSKQRRTGKHSECWPSGTRSTSRAVMLCHVHPTRVRTK